MLATTDKASIIDKYRPNLAPFEDVYRDIHQNPELSDLEVRTANIAASHLKGLDGFLVHRGVGGHGVVGVLDNGPGSVILLRADMDALPLLEKRTWNTRVPKSQRIVKGTKPPSCMPAATICTRLALWQQLHRFMQQGSGP